MIPNKGGTQNAQLYYQLRGRVGEVRAQGGGWGMEGGEGMRGLIKRAAIVIDGFEALMIIRCQLLRDTYHLVL